MTTNKKTSYIFIKKIGLICLPFFAYFLFPIFILIWSGELMPVKDIIKKQMANNQVLTGWAYNNPDKYYKLHFTLAKNPEIIALGTSRVMQIRSMFFKPETAFYNAGGAISKIKHLKIFLDSLPKANTPKVIVLSLDQNFFNPKWDDLKPDDITMRYQETASVLGLLTANAKRIYRDYSDNKIALKDIFERRSYFIGLAAIENNAGFRSDGSRFGQPDQYLPDQRQFEEALEEMEKGSDRFKYSQEINKEALGELALFLENAKERNINVIGFLPPYSQQVYETMKKMGDKYQYIFELEATINNIFQRYGFEVYDFSDVTSFGSSDQEMLNGSHGSEKTYLRLYLTLLEKNPILKNYSDKDFLLGRLKASKSNYTVFGNNEF